MQRSSPSIAALAGALAKAQAELVNPEKSLIGKIKAAGNGLADSGRRASKCSYTGNGVALLDRISGVARHGQQSLHPWHVPGSCTSAAPGQL